MAKTWRVILADDESIIREGIRASIQWAELELELVGEASDGEEALELIREREANILLVDINMPIMNGLELVQHVRTFDLPCKIVIISGHDEFNFAQTAIRHGVSAYLLKPVTPEQINATLAELVAELEEEASQSAYMQMAAKQIERNIPLLRERFFFNWLNDRMATEEIQQQLAFLQLPTMPPKTLWLIRLMDAGIKKVDSEKDRQLMLFAVENIVAEMLNKQAISVVRTLNDFLAIVSWDKLLDEQYIELERNVQAYLAVQLVGKATNLQADYDALPHAFRELSQTLALSTPLSPIVKRARQVIFDRYTDKELTLEQIAEEIPASPVYLSRMIKQELNTTFSSLVTQMRIQKALQLLTSTDKSILEIAEQCGYDTQHYFSTAFKKVMGVSPNQYRKGAIE